jgi:O-antigen/teichoic acid export membrane protein
MALRQIRDSAAYTAAMLFSLLYFKSDIVLLKYLAGEAAAGQYTPVQRLMEPLLMVAALWGTALFPALCRMAHREDADMAQLQASNLRLSLLVSVPMAAGLVLLAEPIVRLLTGDAAAYAGAVVLLRWMALVTPLFYWNSLGQEALYAAGRRWSVAAVYAAAALVNIGVNVLGVPRFGVIAVAWGALLANALISAVFLWRMRQILGALRLPGLLLRVGIATLAMGATAWLLAGFSLLLATLGGAVVFLPVLLVLRPFTAFENEMLRALFSASFRRAG